MITRGAAGESMSNTPDKRVTEIRQLHDIDDPEDCNIDVVVRFADGEQRTATFFTLKNVASLMRNYAETGECMSGRYFWAVDMILVQRLTPEVVRATVEEMVRSGEYDIAFGRASRES